MGSDVNVQTIEMNLKREKKTLETKDWYMTSTEGTSTVSSTLSSSSSESSSSSASTTAAC
jgi:hypothetical protein